MKPLVLAVASADRLVRRTRPEGGPMLLGSNEESEMPSIHRFERARRRASGWAVLGLLIAGILPLGDARAATPPAGDVSDDKITASELLAGVPAIGLSRNDRFVPSRRDKPAREPFNGTLALDGVTMQVLSDAPGGGISNPVLDKDTTFFPDVAIEFFTVDGRLVPATQDVILNGILPGTRSYWDIIVQAGRVWSEPDDRGWNRASFPFALVNSIEGETHMGIALFLYRDKTVSPVRFQIVQMTSPFYVPEYFTAWGTSDAHYARGGPDDEGRCKSSRKSRGKKGKHGWENGCHDDDRDHHRGHDSQRVRDFRAEQAARLPVREWSELERWVSPETLDDFTTYPDVLQSAVVRKGILYRTDCPTGAGPFPYCDDVRYGVWSVTKSAMMNVALLRLAQKYGADILGEPVAPYLPTSETDWQDATFGDIANMASGHGPDGDPTCYLCDYDRWYVALSELEKSAEALDYPSFAPPGTVFNYRDQDAYLLGVALNGFVKAKEGPRASVWKLLRNEVYRPLGIFHAPTNATVEPDGSEGQPLMAYGYYATLDDLAKIALLFQQGGKWKGKQILHRELVARYQPQEAPPVGALPASDDGSSYYLKNWWISPLESDEGCTRYLSSMEGWGGISVALAPEKTVVMRLRNLWIDTPNPEESFNALIDELTTVCPE